MAQVPQRMAARRTKSTSTTPAHRRRRRISPKYTKHLVAIAELYVASSGNASATERAVRKRLGLVRFKADYLAKWLRVPEFATAVRTEEERVATADSTSPYVRGPKRIKWLVGLLDCMQETYEQAVDQEAGKPLLLAAMHKAAGELRAEETHLATQQAARARRSMAALVKGLLKEAKASGEPPTVVAFLARSLANLERIVGTPTEMPDAAEVVDLMERRLKQAGVIVAPKKLRAADVGTMTDEQLDRVIAAGSG